eukprot:jgi/Botrbrau1/16307/Bobra.0066s0075.1
MEVPNVGRLPRFGERRSADLYSGIIFAPVHSTLLTWGSRKFLHGCRNHAMQKKRSQRELGCESLPTDVSGRAGSTFTDVPVDNESLDYECWDNPRAHMDWNVLLENLNRVVRDPWIGLLQRGLEVGVAIAMAYLVAVSQASANAMSSVTLQSQLAHRPEQAVLGNLATGLEDSFLAVLNKTEAVVSSALGLGVFHPFRQAGPSSPLMH